MKARRQLRNAKALPSLSELRLTGQQLLSPLPHSNLPQRPQTRSHRRVKYPRGHSIQPKPSQWLLMIDTSQAKGAQPVYVKPQGAEAKTNGGQLTKAFSPRLLPAGRRKLKRRSLIELKPEMHEFLKTQPSSCSELYLAFVARKSG